MIDARETGERIRLVRAAAGLDQTELADRSENVHQSTISRIENGRTRVTHELLEDLAAALNVTSSFLTHSPDTVPPRRPWLRAYADASKRDVDRLLAECQLVTEIAELLGLQVFPDTIPVFDGELEDDEAIEQYALEVRQAADLSADAVVGNTVRAAERLGCIVLPMSGELGRHLGLSTYANLHPMIFVSRPLSGRENSVPGDRQRFTVAHELGHLALHRDLPAPRDASEARIIEKQAHRFAGAFLMPGDALREELDELGGRVTLRTLAEIKGRWGVAIKSLVVRCRELGMIDSDHARSLYKQISSRGWNKDEPVSVGNEGAIWLTKAIRKAMGLAPDPLAAAADAAGIGRNYLERWTRWDSDRRVDADVVGLPAAPGQDADATTDARTEVAPVVPLYGAGRST